MNVVCWISKNLWICQAYYNGVSKKILNILYSGQAHVTTMQTKVESEKNKPQFLLSVCKPSIVKEKKYF